MPLAQSQALMRKLQENGVPVELLVMPSGWHGPTVPGAENPPDYIGALIWWFDRYLGHDT